jgi:hypothetical protein
VQLRDSLKWNSRDSRRGKCMGQLVKCWYQIMCMHTEDLVKKCHEWPKSTMSVRSWTKELKQELYNM